MWVWVLCGLVCGSSAFRQLRDAWLSALRQVSDGLITLPACVTGEVWRGNVALNYDSSPGNGFPGWCGLFVWLVAAVPPAPLF